MIPRDIVTVWLNENPVLPPLVQHCINSQKRCAKKYGYNHHVITLENRYKDSTYVEECLSRKDVKGYVKASDWLRCFYLWSYGGIYLDADMEVLEGKHFDHVLDCNMFVPRDPQGHYANAGFGAEKGHPLLKHYLERISNNFRGEGELVYEPGIRAFSDMFYISDISNIKMLTHDYFFPYNHHTKKEEITENTIVKHFYLNHWIDKR